MFVVSSKFFCARPTSWSQTCVFLSQSHRAWQLLPTDGRSYWTWWDLRSSSSWPVSSCCQSVLLVSTEPSCVFFSRLVELGRRKQTRPDCYRHFIPRFKMSTRDQVKRPLCVISAAVFPTAIVYFFYYSMSFVFQLAVPPQPGTEGLKLRTVIGYNGNGRGNMVWSPDQG